MNTKAKETRRLHQLRDEHEALGHVVMLSRASLGLFDAVILTQYLTIAVQVKCNRWPDASESARLRAFADQHPHVKVKCLRYNDRVIGPSERLY